MHEYAMKIDGFQFATYKQDQLVVACHSTILIQRSNHHT